MNWFVRQRMAWIDDQLRTTGGVTRRDLAKFFGISAAQASADLRAFRQSHPKETTYDAVHKRYVSTIQRPSEVFSRPECVFRYCPHPELCAAKCRYAGGAP